MSSCKTVVSPSLTYWMCHSLALSHWFARHSINSFHPHSQVAAALSVDPPPCLPLVRTSPLAASQVPIPCPWGAACLARRRPTTSAPATLLSCSIWHREVRSAGPWFNIKMPSYRCRKSHCGDKTVVRSSYLHNGISYTGKTTSLYWIIALTISAYFSIKIIFLGVGFPWSR